MKVLKRIFPYVIICLLLLTTLFIYKTSSNYRYKHDRCMDWLQYVIVMRFDKQSDYLYDVSSMLKNPSTSPSEISAFINGANVFVQQDPLMSGAYNIVFDGKVPNYIVAMRQILNADEDKLSAMSTEEREAFADTCLELSALYDRHNAENSISWYLFKKDYDNPALLSLGDRAAELTEQICR